MAIFSIFSLSIVVNRTVLCQPYENEEFRELVALVNDATELVRTKGEAAFSDFRVSGSRWRQGEMYIFVVDREGNTLVHPDPARRLISSARVSTWNSMKKL